MGSKSYSGSRVDDTVAHRFQGRTLDVYGRSARGEAPVSHWDLNGGWPRQPMSKFWSSVLPYSVASLSLSSAPAFPLTYYITKGQSISQSIKSINLFFNRSINPSINQSTLHEL